MNTFITLRNLIVAVGLLFASYGHAQVYVGVGGYYGGGYYGGNYHGHPGCCGGYGGGWGWGPPNVIISVPSAPPQPAYVFECDNVEVCDNYTDECWIERRCN